jgi:signal transduction histidine kinase
VPGTTPAELVAGERRRIARELHDAISPDLFSTVLHTRAAQRALAERDAGRAGRSLAEIAELARHAQHELRALISELHRDAVHDGLVAALARQASAIDTPGGPAIDVRGPEQGLVLSEQVEAQLFAIGREALVNVEKHAEASAAQVRVEADRDQVVLEVRDDGRGFDPAAGHPGHFGVDSMRSRAAEIGAKIAITSAPGSGTLVRVRVPAATGGP